MSDRDAFADGREQGWRDKERECEKLKIELAKWKSLDMYAKLQAEIERLRMALKEIDSIAVRHMRGAIGNAQRIARAALEAEA